MSKYHAVSSGMVTRQALPSITRQRGTTTGAANVMLYGAGKTTVSNNTTFIDSSANAFTVTRNGDTVQSGFNPFSQASAGAGYFDGTGDYLTAPNNAAFSFPAEFTIEMWIYPITQLTINAGNTTVLFFVDGTNGLQIGAQSATAWGLANKSVGWRLTTTTLPTLSTWNHIAISRNSSNNTAIFLNGTRVANGTVTDSFGAGLVYVGFASAYALAYNGYMSNLRAVKGTAIYDPTLTTLTVPTSPLTAITNTSLLLLMDNYSIVNSSPTNLPVTINGNTTISTAQYPTGMSSSIYFDGTGDYLLTANNAIFTFGTGDFTIEFYARYESYGSGGGNFVSNTSDNLNIYYSNTGKLGYWNGTAGTESSGSVPLSTWFHCAAVRSGTTVKIYYNGTSVITTTDSRNITTNNMVFGRNGTAGSLDLNGYLSNVRVCKGTALYTANFTPPALPMSTTVTVPNFVTNNIYGVNQIP